LPPSRARTPLPLREAGASFLPLPLRERGLGGVGEQPNQASGLAISAAAAVLVYAGYISGKEVCYRERRRAGSTAT
jgi:hypothetical protein